jgi:hypothetical protein
MTCWLARAPGFPQRRNHEDIPSMRRQIILDTETTGLEVNLGHRVIEIGCVELRNRRVTDNNFHQYLNPERDIDAAAEEVHGISRHFLADKPRFEDIAQQLWDYLADAELIIHNASFDIGFLNAEFTRAGFRRIEEVCTVTDTLLMARQLRCLARCAAVGRSLPGDDRWAGGPGPGDQPGLSGFRAVGCGRRRHRRGITAARDPRRRNRAGSPSRATHGTAKKGRQMSLGSGPCHLAGC